MKCPVAQLTRESKAIQDQATRTARVADVISLTHYRAVSHGLSTSQQHARAESMAASYALDRLNLSPELRRSLSSYVVHTSNGIISRVAFYSGNPHRLDQRHEVCVYRLGE